MKTLKIRPVSLTLLWEMRGCWGGELTYTIEQYGLMMPLFKTHLTITPPSTEDGPWYLNADDHNALNLDNFSIFSDALLYHLVQDAKLLAWDTHEVLDGAPLLLHFGDVYFEI
ncbi:MAG: hypothetical protein EBQ82_03045 [Betaproteobacteria bacterium]|nr:hypothetical protein [Betaproteobacteria bacterium]NBY04387.1 hypothetical protein [Betaproteobacteria bacterium]